MTPLKILFDNSHFVAVDKAAETLSVPSRMGEEEKRPIVGRLLQDQLGIQIYPVHRLDFEVSGLLLFAKNPEAHRVANSAFENHSIKKTYQALAPATDTPLHREYEWIDKLFRGKKRSFVAEHGKEAITQARKIRNLKKWDLWELAPLTGRAHQLRVHMMLHEKPIVGDDLYGSKDTWPRPGIALRAVKIHFPEELLRFDLPPVLEAENDWQSIF